MTRADSEIVTAPLGRTMISSSALVLKPLLIGEDCCGGSGTSAAVASRNQASGSCETKHNRNGSFTHSSIFTPYFSRKYFSAEKKLSRCRVPSTNTPSFKPSPDGETKQKATHGSDFTLSRTVSSELFNLSKSTCSSPECSSGSVRLL